MPVQGERDLVGDDQAAGLEGSRRLGSQFYDSTIFKRCAVDDEHRNWGQRTGSGREGVQNGVPPRPCLDEGAAEWRPGGVKART
jgi:hypothetical protein